MTDYSKLIQILREGYLGYADKAADAIADLHNQLAAKQAQIDSLMLEYCPDEMTTEQIEEWGKHQVHAPVADAHELWAAAQLVPGEGVEDGVARIEALLKQAPKEES